MLHPHVNEKFREEKGSFLFNPIACMHLSIGTPLLLSYQVSLRASCNSPVVCVTLVLSVCSLSVKERHGIPFSDACFKRMFKAHERHEGDDETPFKAGVHTIFSSHFQFQA